MKHMNKVLAVLAPLAISGLFFLPGKGIVLTVVLGYFYWRVALKPAYLNFLNYLK